MRMIAGMIAAAVLVLAGVQGGHAQQGQQSGGSQQEPVPQYWFGVAVENIPPAIARQLQLQPNQGLMVVAVLADSPAQKAGLKADDLLIEINGKALKSQADLAQAANTGGMIQVDTARGGRGVGGGASLVQASQMVYMRDGLKTTLQITPERRPGAMAVSGANVKGFTLNGGAQSGVVMRNYTMPNGSTVYVGPGYQVDSGSQGTNMRVLRDAVGKGETLVLTQETDEAGNVKNMISDGKNTYVVEAGKLDKLPANLRPLGQQMLSAQIGTPAKQEAQVSLEDRLKRLEQQNAELRGQLDELMKLLKEKAKQGN